MPASAIAAVTALAVFHDLCGAADLFGEEVPRVRHADAQALAGHACRALSLAPREHRDMRAEHAFGATRHHEGDALLDRLWRKAEFWRQRRAQRSNGIFPGEVVDTAIALGLAEDGQNRCRVDRAGADDGHEAGDVAGAGGGDLEDADRCRPHDWSLRGVRWSGAANRRGSAASVKPQAAISDRHPEALAPHLGMTGLVSRPKQEEPVHPHECGEIASGSTKKSSVDGCAPHLDESTSVGP
ncbi:hypothetical protein ABIF79_000073 [Bradyrhizobium japonicum]